MNSNKGPNQADSRLLTLRRSGDASPGHQPHKRGLKDGAEGVPEVSSTWWTLIGVHPQGTRRQ